MRELLNKYGIYVVAAGFVIVLLVIFFYSRAPAPISGNPALAFYVDDETGAETTGPVNQYPPLPGKNGKNTLVRAIKYTCDGKTFITAYLMKYSDEALEKLKALPPVDTSDPAAPNPAADILAEGEMVRLPASGSPWVKGNSDEAGDIRIIPSCPDGKHPVLASPRR